jgi:DNA-binding YbaB/EbfC family protein
MDNKDVINNIINKLQDNKNNIEALSCSAEAGAGMVKITINGKKEITQIDIADELLNKESKEILQDLIAAASKLASDKIEEAITKNYTESFKSLISKNLF